MSWVLARAIDPLEEIQLDASCGRVRRKADHQHLRLGNQFADRALQLLEEIHVRRHAHRTDVGAGDDRTVDVDRVAGIGHEHGVAAVQACEHQVREPLLGAYGDDRLGVRIEFDAVAPPVPGADRAAQPRDALGHRVAVRVAALGGFDELRDDVRGRGPVRVAHAHVDDVLARMPRRHLQLVGDVEDVRGKALDAGELSHGGGPGVHSQIGLEPRCNAKSGNVTGHLQHRQT